MPQTDPRPAGVGCYCVHELAKQLALPKSPVVEENRSMRLQEDKLLLSASDLSAHLGCQHRTQLDRRAALGQVEAPPPDPALAVLQRFEVSASAQRATARTARPDCATQPPLLPGIAYPWGLADGRHGPGPPCLGQATIPGMTAPGTGSCRRDSGRTDRMKGRAAGLPAVLLAPAPLALPAGGCGGLTRLPPLPEPARRRAPR